MVGRKKEGPKFKQRVDEVLKNLAKDALAGMDKLAKVPEAVQAQILSRIALGRFGKPEEIAMMLTARSVNVPTAAAA